MEKLLIVTKIWIDIFCTALFKRNNEQYLCTIKKSNIYGFINSLEKEFCLLFKMQKSLLKQIKVIILVIWE